MLRERQVLAHSCPTLEATLGAALAELLRVVTDMRPDVGHSRPWVFIQNQAAMWSLPSA